ncbi:MAG: DNA-3-methyladenine glycosylase I [bacterium]
MLINFGKTSTQWLNSLGIFTKADLQKFGSFDRYIWQLVGGKPKLNAWKTLKKIPPKTSESNAMSKDLKKRGFSFVGSTICYAFMQAVGMVNDHLITCFRYRYSKV